MSGRPGVRVAGAIALCALLLAPGAARAQDFAAPGRPGPAGAAALLEHGLAPADAAAELSVLGVRRWGLPEGEGAALHAGFGWRTLRLAAGLARAGDEVVGWRTAGLALGAAGGDAGLALRAALHEDVAPATGGTVRAHGLEAGGGAWMRLGPGLLWISAPQLRVEGAAPPLARGLELGAVVETGALALWAAHETPRPASHAPPASLAAGLVLEAGPLAVGLAARERPLRGVASFEARLGALAAGLEVESHPVLGETTRLSLSLASGRR
jgi:hypothetical protein